MESNQIKIVIADDEKAILRGLRKILQQLNGVCICADATDGDQLFSSIVSQKPDLVITDICMPKMSGVEVLKRIQSLSPAPRVILISGYQDFEYAREGLKYGALDYLLKPIETDKLLSLVAEQQKEIIKSRSRDMFARSILEPEETLWDEDTSYYSVIIVQPLILKDLPKVYAFLNETLTDRHHVVRQHQYLCVIRQFYHEPVDKTAVYAYAVKLQNALFTELSVSADLSVGEPFLGKSGISKSYHNAEELLELSYFFDDPKVYCSEDRLSFDGTNDGNENELIKQIAASIHALDETQALSALHILTQIIYKNSGGSRDIAIMQLYSSISLLLQTLDTFPGSDAYTTKNLLSFFNEGDKFHSAVTFVEEMISDMIHRSSGNKKFRDSFEIERVKEYVNHHLSENITLEAAAKIAYKNIYYFSVFFKKHTGENFKDYVIRCKMEAAMDYLKNSDKKIYEISELVGFADYKHFSRTFKKHFGICARDVRLSR